MLNIKKFEVNDLQENCYIVSDETKEAIIIDPGMFYTEEREEVKEYVDSHLIQLVHLLNTHGHFDHTYSNRFVFDTFGLKVKLHAEDIALYQSLSFQIETFLRRHIEEELAPIEKGLSDADEIKFGNHTFTVLHTPGHTLGGICLYCQAENILFSGDSLFYHSIGRTDFPGGSEQNLLCSLREKILRLPNQTKVYPGHGPQTNIGEERSGNPYLR
ncbi:MAG: MBL fold metallo-hydrolase [Bacteroidaceae bacterium]